MINGKDYEFIFKSSKCDIKTVVLYTLVGFIVFWIVAGASLKLGWYLIGKLMGFI